MSKSYIALASLFFFFLTSIAHSDNSTDKPTVALFVSYPETFKGKDGTFQGTAVDIVKTLEEGLGQEIGIKYTSWPRIMEYLGTNDYDLTFLFNVPTFKNRVHFLGKIGCFADIIVPRKGLQISDISSLSGKTVAFMQKGAFAQQYLDTKLFHTIPTSQSEKMIRLLVNDRVDAIVIHSGQYHRLINAAEGRQFYPENWRSKLGEPFVHKLYEVQVTLSKQSKFQHLIPVLKETIIQQREKGLFDQAQKNWGMSFWPCD
jgi:hypothetical protein